MIALPVLAVSAADVVYKTTDVERRRSRSTGGWARPTRGSPSTAGAGRSSRASTPTTGRHSRRRPRADPVTLERSAARSVATYPPPRSRTSRCGSTPTAAWPRRGDRARRRLTARRGPVPADLGPLAGGRRRGGRQRGAGRQGLRGGSELTVHDGPTLTVVGIAESHDRARTTPSPSAPLGGLGARPPRATRPGWSAAGPVAWDEVRALNADRGARAVACRRRGPAARLRAARRGPAVAGRTSTTPGSPSSCWSW